jgi:hypothetical protein
MIADDIRPSVGPDLREWGSLTRAEQAALKAPFDGLLPPATINALMRHSGFRTPERIRLAEDRELLAIDNIGPTSVTAIRQHFPRFGGGEALVQADHSRRVGKCGACESVYLVHNGHGVYDCVGALLRRIKQLENSQV